MELKKLAPVEINSIKGVDEFNYIISKCEKRVRVFIFSFSVDECMQRHCAYALCSAAVNDDRRCTGSNYLVLRLPIWQNSE